MCVSSKPVNVWITCLATQHTDTRFNIQASRGHIPESRSCRDIQAIHSSNYTARTAFGNCRCLYVYVGNKNLLANLATVAVGLYSSNRAIAKANSLSRILMLQEKCSLTAIWGTEDPTDQLTAVSTPPILPAKLYRYACTCLCYTLNAIDIMSAESRTTGPA